MEAVRRRVRPLAGQRDVGRVTVVLRSGGCLAVLLDSKGLVKMNAVSHRSFAN